MAPKGIESGYVCVVIPAVAQLVDGQPVTITDVVETLQITRSKLESDDWPYRHRKLGMVLTWGIASKDLSTEGWSLAQRFNEEILSQLQDPEASETETFPSRAFWHGRGGRDGNIMLDIYFVAEAGLPEAALVPPGNKAVWTGTDPLSNADCDTWD